MTEVLGPTSKTLGTSRIYFENRCGREKYSGSVCFEQGEACTSFIDWIRAQCIYESRDFTKLVGSIVLKEGLTVRCMQEETEWMDFSSH